MFQAAVDEAIAEDVVNEEMRISLDDVRDDTALMTIAGKLDMLSKDREFKRFLEAPMEEEETMAEEMREETGATPMSAEEEDEFMMGRM
jgi:hypothetical protein